MDFWRQQEGGDVFGGLGDRVLWYACAIRPARAEFRLGVTLRCHSNPPPTTLGSGHPLEGEYVAPPVTYFVTMPDNLGHHLRQFIDAQIKVQQTKMSAHYRGSNEYRYQGRR